MPSGDDAGPERVIGRYALYGEIASGGMATVHIGRLLGPVGFSRTVAIKRLHTQYARDPEFVSMFLDEARLAARIRHPNAIPTLDVVVLDGELFLVMEYVQGESLSRLLRFQRAASAPIPLPIVGAVMSGALHGLHSAHEAKSERGEPLGLVHRDISPQNIMVGSDGIARVLDFGVAKAAGRVQTTREGQIKGKLPYMAPEQIRGEAIDRRVDIYAASVVLWEMLAGRALFRGDNDGLLFSKVIAGADEPPSRHQPDLSPAVDEVVMRGLALDPAARFATAEEMAIALENATGVAAPRVVGQWTDRLAGAAIAERAERVKEIESSSSSASIPSVGEIGERPRAEPSRDQPRSRPPGEKHESQSQVSSVSLSGNISRNPPTNPRSRAQAIYLIGAALVVAFGAGATLMWMGGRPATGASADVPTATARSEEQPIASASPPVLPSSAAPEATDASGAASAAPPMPRLSSAAVAPKKKAAAVQARPAHPSCNPPYIVDSQGIKRPKPECL